MQFVPAGTLKLRRSATTSCASPRVPPWFATVAFGLCDAFGASVASPLERTRNGLAAPPKPASDSVATAAAWPAGALSQEAPVSEAGERNAAVPSVVASVDAVIAPAGAATASTARTVSESRVAQRRTRARGGEEGNTAGYSGVTGRACAHPFEVEHRVNSRPSRS